MGALRKAGVWLGLVEDEDDRYDAEDTDDDFDGSGRYDGPVRYEAPGRYDQHRPRHDTERDLTGRQGAERDTADRDYPVPDYADNGIGEPDYGDDDFGVPAEAARPRMNRVDREERASVRPLNRASVTPLSQDNLARAPQTRVRERAVVSDESQDGYRITTVHPTTYSEARTIGEHFRDHTPVIMNLSEMEEADAMRLVDFAAGLIFGLRGNIERVTNRVFLLSPADVTVTAEDKAKIAEGGFFNQS